MTSRDPRREELIAGAVGDDLDEAERAELRALAAEDATVDDEIRSMRDTVAQLNPAAGLRWADTEPSELLRRRVVGKDRSRWVSVAAAAAGVAIGVGAVLGVQATRDRPGTVTATKPGELGAFEAVDFTDETVGVTVDGGLVAHTWGTETVLEMEGVPVNEIFEVFLVDRSGVDRLSGTFLGSDVPIDCRMNAAILRGDVAGIEIRAAAGIVVARASVPKVA